MGIQVARVVVVVVFFKQHPAFSFCSTSSRDGKSLWFPANGMSTHPLIPKYFNFKSIRALTHANFLCKPPSFFTNCDLLIDPTKMSRSTTSDISLDTKLDLLWWSHLDPLKLPPFGTMGEVHKKSNTSSSCYYSLTEMLKMSRKNYWQFWRIVLSIEVFLS